jgi:uncharacterized protein (TIGR02996 family)
MAVHFVYRCPYVGPSGRHVAHFPDDTVLAWVRRVWPLLVVPEDREQAYPRLAELLGCSVYDFDNYFQNAAEHGVGPPASEAQLREQIEGLLSVQELAHYRPHAMQALTDDDDVMLAYFLFDDHFVRKHPERTAFLLAEGWRLPDGAGEGGFEAAVKTYPIEPAGKGEGTTYLIPMGIYYGDHLDCMGYSQRFDGVRLPDLARHLLRTDPEEDQWPRELIWLKEGLLGRADGGEPQEAAFIDTLRSDPDDEATWRAYSDWLADRGRPSAGVEVLRRALEGVAADGVNERWKHDPSLSRFQVEEHLAVMGIHTLAQPLGRGGVRNHWDQWYFFDDLWASAHPDLANGLLNYGLRWDALSAWRSRPLEPR